MGTKNMPCTFDCYANAEPDEPMFVLLARDVQAPWLVRQWAAERRVRAESAPSAERETELRQVEEALSCADDMDAWRKARRS